MTDTRDFDLPVSFIHKVQQAQTAKAGRAHSVQLKPESEFFVQEISEQTGLTADAIAAALVEEGLIEFRSRGILF
jgi:hypothetical protein